MVELAGDTPAIDLALAYWVRLPQAPDSCISMEITDSSDFTKYNFDSTEYGNVLHPGRGHW
jgi:hypothetical protein